MVLSPLPIIAKGVDASLELPLLLHNEPILRPRARWCAMAKIAIVGGSGFLGTRLAAKLRSSGHIVTVVDLVPPRQPDLAFRSADVRQRDTLMQALAGVEIVYNLAAVHRDDVKPASLYDEVNVDGAVNLCSVCGDHRIRQIIFTSSVAVYGQIAADASEEQVPAPDTPYGRSKLRAEVVHHEWQAEDPDRRAIVIVRPTAIFGEGSRGNIDLLLRQVAAGRFLMVGQGRNRKSMAYVGNVSEFLTHVLRFRSGTRVFNYADKPDLTTAELLTNIRLALGRPANAPVRIPYSLGLLGGLACDIVSSVTGRRLPISAFRIRKFCSTTTYSSNRLLATGFKAPVTLGEAIERTIADHIRQGLGN